MNRWALAILMMLSTSMNAQEVTDECLQSMQEVYKFYYHEILPKGTSDTNQKLGLQEAQQMDAVISKLKSSCTPELIAKMNHLLQSDTNHT